MTTLKRPWINLIIAPLSFLVVMIVMSVYYASQGVQEELIPLKVSENIPALILVVQVILLVTIYRTAKKDNFNIFEQGWQSENKKQTIQQIGFGILTGIFLTLIYFSLLMPLQTLLQNNIGDFVPAGETLKALGTQNLIFFIANVVLAPFVEESIYRNYVLTRFLEKYSKRKSIILSALFFGLLHWTGGVWYMLMTALFVGVPFALIVVQKKNILWVYTAHLTLNFLEFNYIFFS